MADNWSIRGVPIHRSGPRPEEPDAGLPAEQWGTRGVSVTRANLNNTDVKPGKTKSPSLEPFAKGTW